MKKLLVLVLSVFLLIGCTATEEVLESSLVDQVAGKWLLSERHMIIEFKESDEPDAISYVEFKDSFDLESQVQARHIRYSPEEEYVLDSERVNATAFYTQTFTDTTCAVENFIQSENTYYTITYGDGEIHYKLDETKSDPNYVDKYEVNGFVNKVTFVGDAMELELILTEADLSDDPNYEVVKEIRATMVLIPYVAPEGFEEETSDPVE